MYFFYLIVWFLVFGPDKPLLKGKRGTELSQFENTKKTIISLEGFFNL
jgi:hypothetical protein